MLGLDLIYVEDFYMISLIVYAKFEMTLGYVYIYMWLLECGHELNEMMI